MKLGIVGAGMIVNDFFGCIHDCDMELIAICATARNEENLKKIVSEHGFKTYYTDYDEMLKNEEIDTVYIAVPNYLHYRYGLKALNAGKNVIMEKPFSSNYAQTEKLYDLAKQKDLIIIEAITTLYLPTYQQIKEQLKNIGDLKIVTVNFTQYSSKYDAFKQGIIKPAFDVHMSGGTLMDLNIYNIHFIVDLFGEPDEVSYLANMEQGVDTSGILTMSYPDFKAVSIAAKDCACPYISALQGNKGSITFYGPANFLTGFDLRIIKKGNTAFERNEKHRMKYEFDKFIEVIDKHDTEFADKMMQESLAVMRVIDKAKKSANIVFEDDSVI